MRALRRRWREILLAVASIAVALVFAEIIFRLYLGHRARADLERVNRGEAVTKVDTCDLGGIVRLSKVVDLFYELKPNLRGRFCGQPLTTNALGMRSTTTPEVRKPGGVFRIIGLGDSYLFGQGVADGQAFLEVLQERALRSGRPLEMLNFAVPGYNSWMEWVVLSARARHFAPDVILVSVIGNDWDLPNFMLSHPYGDIAHSFLLGLLWERVQGPPELLSTPRSRFYGDHYLTVPEEVPKEFRHMVGFEAYRRALMNILRVAEENDARVVLFSDCVSKRARGSRRCGFPFDRGQYERIRAEVYDNPRVTICTWNLPEDLLIPRDGHPTPEGHVSLADQLDSCWKGVVP